MPQPRRGLANAGYHHPANEVSAGFRCVFVNEWINPW